MLLIMKKTFKIPIYTGKIKIIITNKFSKTLKQYKIHTDLSYDAVMFTHKNKYIMVFDKKYINYSVIAHEIVHTVNVIFKEHHLLLDVDNDEAQAYLTGWIMEKFEKLLKKN